MYLARGVDGVRWELAALPGNQARSRLLRDFSEEDDDSLSVWWYGSEEELEDVVVAIAAARQKIARLDLMPVPEELCERFGIQVSAELGETPYEAAKERHRNLAEVTALQAAQLTQSLRTEVVVRRFPDARILDLLVARMQSGDPSLDALNPKVVEALLTRKLWDREECLRVIRDALAANRIKEDALSEKTRRAVAQ